MSERAKRLGMALGLLALAFAAMAREAYAGAKDVAFVPQPSHVAFGAGHASSSRVTRHEDPSVPKEGYRIVIDANGVDVYSSDDAGAFYAGQTLAQLPHPFPVMTIEDSPAYAWRGVHLDEARHFFGKATVKRLLDLMAQHKLNRFHWHLTDDQGWRLAIPGYPELSRYSTVRSSDQRPGFNTNDPDEAARPENNTGSAYGPFVYEESDVREIVDYAAARHIVVVPEIDLPGHVYAALAAYPEFACKPENAARRDPRLAWGVSDDVLCVGNDRAVRFVEDVVDYVMSVFPSRDIHLGGDECPAVRWKSCPKCCARMAAEGLEDERELESWLLSRLARRLAGQGRRAICWNDALRHPRLLGNPVVMCWMAGATHEEMSRIYVSGAASAGYDVIATPYWQTYLGKPQGLKGDTACYRGKEVVTLEICHAFDPAEGVPSANRQRVLGGEACNWTESTRGEKELFGKMWPRTAALAEALWCGTNKPAFSDFLARMKRHDLRLAAAGVDCFPATPQPPVTRQAFDGCVSLTGRLFRAEICGGITNDAIRLFGLTGEPFGTLHLATRHAGASECRRELEVENATVKVDYRWNGRRYSRSYRMSDDGAALEIDLLSDWDYVLDVRCWLEKPIDGGSRLAWELEANPNDGRLETAGGHRVITGSSSASVRLVCKGGQNEK